MANQVKGNQVDNSHDEKLAGIAHLPHIAFDPEAKKDPFRGLMRNMVANHSERVGRGFLAPEGTVVRSIQLADGSSYRIMITRIERATKDVEAFPKRKKKARKPKTS